MPVNLLNRLLGGIWSPPVWVSAPRSPLAPLTPPHPQLQSVYSQMRGSQRLGVLSTVLLSTHGKKPLLLLVTHGPKKPSATDSSGGLKKKL